MEDIPDTQPADIGTKDIPSGGESAKYCSITITGAVSFRLARPKAATISATVNAWKNIANNGDIMQQQLTQALEAYLQKLDDEARIEAINAFRRAPPLQPLPLAARRLRAVGQTGAGRPNDYNPNNVAPPEKRLLQTSLEADGFTQPVVVIQQRPQAYTIVDGFHRHELACSKAALKKR